MKNLEFAAVLPFAQQVQYQKGQVVSKTIAQSKALSLTLFAFDKGEEISTHASSGDALVIVLDGQGQITIDDTSYILNAGDSIIMPAQHPHSVFPKGVSMPPKFAAMVCIIKVNAIHFKLSEFLRR